MNEFRQLETKAADRSSREKQLQADFNNAKDEQSSDKSLSKVQAVALRLLDEGGTSTTTLEAPPDLAAMKDDLTAAGPALRMCEARLVQARITASHEFSDSLAGQHSEAIYNIMQALQLLHTGLQEHCVLYQQVRKAGLKLSGSIRNGQMLFNRRPYELAMTLRSTQQISNTLDRLAKSWPDLAGELGGA